MRLRLYPTHILPCYKYNRRKTKEDWLRRALWMKCCLWTPTTSNQYYLTIPVHWILQLKQQRTEDSLILQIELKPFLGWLVFTISFLNHFCDLRAHATKIDSCSTVKIRESKYIYKDRPATFVWMHNKNFDTSVLKFHNFIPIFTRVTGLVFNIFIKHE